MYTHMYIYIYIHTHIYTYIYIYIYIYIRNQGGEEVRSARLFSCVQGAGLLIYSGRT